MELWGPYNFLFKWGYFTPVSWRFFPYITTGFWACGSMGKYMRSLLEWGSLGYLGICWSSPTQTTAEAMKGLICTNSYTPMWKSSFKYGLISRDCEKKPWAMGQFVVSIMVCFIKYCKVVGSLGFSCIKCYAMMIGHPRSMDDWSDFSTKNKISPTQDTRRAPSRSL